MLTQEEFVEMHALRKRGWSISAIARHLGRDRKTVRAHLQGERVAGQRRRAGEDRFEKFEPYLRQRLGDDPHLWGTALYDEVKDLGYPQSYPTFVRQLRRRRLRPHCSRLQRGEGTTDRPDRAPAGGGVSVGLART